MTNQQKPEALRLAEHLERFRSFPDDLLAAAELRLMHSEKTELLARVDELIHQRDAAQEVAAMNAKSGASWAARVQELETQLESIGAGGVEPLRKPHPLDDLTRLTEQMGGYDGDFWKGNHPPLPDTMTRDDTVHGQEYYPAGPMRAYLEADRAMRTQAAPADWVPCTIAFDGDAEEVAYGPKIMMDRLAKWLGKYFEMVAAKKAAPAAVAVPDGWKLVLPGGKRTDKWDSSRIGDYNQGWNDYRKAAIRGLENREQKTSQDVAKQLVNWLRNNYQDHANIASLCDAMLAAAPQPPVVAQEPVAWMVYLPSAETQHVYDSQDDIGYVDDLTNNDDAEVTPLYPHPAPQQAAQGEFDADDMQQQWDTAFQAGKLASAPIGYTDGGRNMFYEGRFEGESAREQKVRLAWADNMRAAFERYTANSWFDKDWHRETALWAAAWRACQQEAQGDARALIRSLLTLIERNTCEHDETYRGGAIWEICSTCGKKWADDEGGKPAVFEWPAEVEAAREYLLASRAQANTRQIAECYGDCPADPKTCTNPCNFEGRAARAQAKEGASHA